MFATSSGLATVTRAVLVPGQNADGSSRRSVEEMCRETEEEP